MTRHFLDLDLLGAGDLRAILDRAAALQRARPANLGRAAPDADTPLAGRILAMLFEKPSTRTRVSFHVAMRQLGGETIELTGSATQRGRGETAADTARVLSRYVDAIMVRTGDHGVLLEMAEHATVPVLNGLTDRSHPCQVIADLLTVEQHLGPVAGKTLAWCGAGNNMSHSWIHAAVRFRFALRLACPPELGPDAGVLAWARAEGGDVLLTPDPAEAVAGADAVMTDTWVSMADQDSARRRRLLGPYRVTPELFASAAPGALFLHCLPAHRGEEVAAEVLDGPRSAVWDEAANRVPAQKAILAWCLP